MEVNLIVETLKFLVLGMSTVFMFLVLMVFVMELQSKIILKYFPQKEEPILYPQASQKVHKKDDLAIVAAIATALKLNKKTK